MTTRQIESFLGIGSPEERITLPGWRQIRGLDNSRVNRWVGWDQINSRFLLEHLQTAVQVVDSHAQYEAAPYKGRRTDPIGHHVFQFDLLVGKVALAIGYNNDLKIPHGPLRVLAQGFVARNVAQDLVTELGNRLEAGPLANQLLIDDQNKR